MTQIFNTSDVNDSHRKGFWSDVVCRAYAYCDCDFEKDQDFYAATEVCDLGLAEVTLVNSTPVHYLRLQRDLKQDGRDDFFLQLILDGSAQISQAGRCTIQHKGDVLLYDAGRPYEFFCRESYRAITVRLNRSLVQSRIITADTLGGTVVVGQSVMGQLAADMMKNLYRVSRDGNVSEPVLRSMIDLLSGAFASGIGLGKDLSRAEGDKLAQVKAYLLDNISNEELNLEQVARDQNMSQRSLSRLFNNVGATPMGWLQTQRLRAAHAALAEGRARSVTEAAYAFGFNDLSNFGRVFKKMYGETPRNVMLPRH